MAEQAQTSAESDRRTAYEHHLAQMDRNGDGTALCSCETCRRHRAAVRSAESARRRPLLQYVIRKLAQPDADGSLFVIERSQAGSKPSHALIFGPPTRFGKADTIEHARALLPPECKNTRRRRDDPADVVEVWV